MRQLQETASQSVPSLPGSSLSHRRALVLLTGVDPDLPFKLKTIRSLARGEFSLHYLLSDQIQSFSTRLDLALNTSHLLSEAEIPRLLLNIHDYFAFLLPSPQFSFMQKLIALDDSDPFVDIILTALIHNIRVITLTDGFRPSKDNSVAEELLKSINELLAGIKALKVHVSTAEELGSILFKEQTSLVQEKDLITESDVLELNRNGIKELYLATGSIVTPLARDRARELGIDIIYKG